MSVLSSVGGGVVDEDESPEDTFRRIYSSHFDAILGFGMRRLPAQDAADVVAEIFLVAWRRLPEVPGEPSTRLWLYGVARRVIANHRRGAERREALDRRVGQRLREQLAAHAPDPSVGVTERLAAQQALGRLADRDREVVELSAWEGLAPREIAEVLGISAIAVRTRLSRSRSRLRDLIDPTPREDQQR